MSRVCSCFASDRSECACGAWDEDYQDQLQQAHRAGWEQAKDEAIRRCGFQERNMSEMSAAFYVAAMTYKEPTNICLKEIDRLNGELEEYKKICDTWETIDKQSNALLSTAKAALEQEESHTTELCKELAEARAEIDKTYKTWCGRDYMHLPLSTAMGSVVAQARQEAASECIEAIEYEHGILGLAFTLRQRFGLDDE